MIEPIDKMLDEIEWVELTNENHDKSDIPVATHRGILEIEGYKFECYQLNDGRRVIDSDEIEKFFGAERTEEK